MKKSKQNKLIGFSVVIILIIVALLYYNQNNYSVISGDYSISTVDINDKGDVTVTAGVSRQYYAPYGMYYIEVDNKPYGYYTFFGESTFNRDRMKIYSNKINVLSNTTGSHTVDVYSSIRFANTGDGTGHGFEDKFYCGMTQYSNLNYKDKNTFDHQVATINEFGLCSRGLVSGSNTYYRTESDGTCWKYSSKNNVRYKDVQVFEGQCLYYKTDMFDKFIPSETEISMIKSNINYTHDTRQIGALAPIVYNITQNVTQNITYNITNPPTPQLSLWAKIKLWFSEIFIK